MKGKFLRRFMLVEQRVSRLKTGGTLGGEGEAISFTSLSLQVRIIL